MSKTISKSRAWAIVTIIVVACIVATAIGLGIGLQKKNDDDGDEVDDKIECPAPEMPPSSSRLTIESPVYVKPSNFKEGYYRFATVSTDTPICSYYGTETIVRHGGSAVDAAIVSILCNGVYNPQSCGIGGGFFMTYYKKSKKKAYAVMAREMAPGAATEHMYTNGTSSREGGIAIGIPGEIKGLHEAWKLGGKLPWSSLFKPAIQMCSEGFPVGKLLQTDIQNNKEVILRHGELKNMLTNPDTGELFNEGEMLKLPKLAETLQKIAEDPYSYYNGSLADDIAQDIQDGAGIITLDDLNKYTAAVKDALTLKMNTGDYTVHSPPPPSSGAVILLILNILDGFNLTADSLSTGEKAAETFHRIVEAFKHGFSVRTNLGDMDQEDQTFNDTIIELLQNMTSLPWGAMKRQKITRDTHDTAYYEPTYAVTSPDAGTTHISVLGPEGDAVSITSTINHYFGSKIVGNRTGIVFNNEMDDFSTPNTTNYFGVPASPANFIKPYKRPLSSMSPTIVTDKDGDVKLVTGATGGTRIITSTALSILQTLMLELGLKESTDFPRMHHQLEPVELRIENTMPQEVGAIFSGKSVYMKHFDKIFGAGCEAIPPLQSAVRIVVKTQEIKTLSVANHLRTCYYNFMSELGTTLSIKHTDKWHCLRVQDGVGFQVILDGLLSRGHELNVAQTKLGSSVQAVLTRNKRGDTVQNILNKQHTEIFSYSDPVRNGQSDGV